MEKERFFKTEIVQDSALATDGDPNTILGSIEYGSLSQEMRNRKGRFFERLVDGCFDRSIEDEGRAIDLKIEHRTSLLRKEGDYFDLESFRGALCFTARLTSQLGLLCLEDVENGELGISPCWARGTVKDRWFTENGRTIREIVEADLLEVSLVRSASYPAFTVKAPERKRMLVEAKATIFGDRYPGAIAVEPAPFMVPGFDDIKQKP